MPHRFAEHKLALGQEPKAACMRLIRVAQEVVAAGAGSVILGCSGSGRCNFSASVAAVFIQMSISSVVRRMTGIAFG